MNLRKEELPEEESDSRSEQFQNKAKIVKPWPKRPSRKMSGSRWTSAVVFIITVVICLGLYVSANLADWEKKISEPLVITAGKEATPTIAATPTPSYAEVVNQVNQMTMDLRGRYGFYVKRLDSGASYGLKQQEVFPSASIIKLPVIMALYEDSEAGKVDLESKYTLKQADKAGGAGTLAGQANGSTWTYRKLVELMGHYSDNTAFGVVRRLEGDERVNKTIKEIGMNKTSLANFETSPEDVGRLFDWMYKGGLNLNDRNEILGYITNTVYEDRIPAGVPKGIRVAHKVGTDLGVYADGGIVFAKRPFILVIMTEDARDDEATKVVPQIAKAVWDFENK
jgi:beta-lactamase class A